MEKSVFDSKAAVYTYDVKNPAILAILRENEEERFIGIFNFGDQAQTAWMDEVGIYTNLLTGENMELHNVVIPRHDFLWVSKEK